MNSPFTERTIAFVSRILEYCIIAEIFIYALFAVLAAGVVIYSIVKTINKLRLKRLY